MSERGSAEPSEGDRALDRMEATLTDVSDLAAVDDGSLEPEPLETAAVAESAWEMVPADDVTLRVTAERPVEADESRLHGCFRICSRTR